MIGRAIPGVRRRGAALVAVPGGRRGRLGDARNQCRGGAAAFVALTAGRARLEFLRGGRGSRRDDDGRRPVGVAAPGAVPAGGPDLHGLRGGGGLRRGHEDRSPLPPLPPLRIRGRRRVRRGGRCIGCLRDARLLPRRSVRRTRSALRGLDRGAARRQEDGARDRGRPGRSGRHRAAARWRRPRCTDGGFGAPFVYAATNAGQWQVVPPFVAVGAQTPWVAFMRPFTLETASQFRAPPAPLWGAHNTRRTSTRRRTTAPRRASVRTPDETAIARFWNANVPSQQNQLYRDVAVQHGMDLVDTVHLMAMGSLTTCRCRNRVLRLEVPLPRVAALFGNPER